ncbi:MAG: hypothetical protein FWE23_11215 [Chitinivibrionia bacterium]|nr:hypothetical protein [Chitinivibrionia bacterium]
MLKNLIVFFFLLLSLAPLSPIMAQCPDAIGQRPVWTNGRHLPPETNVSYFRVIYGRGRTITEAREQARQEVFRRRSVITGEHVQVRNENLQSNNTLEIKYDLVCEFHQRRKDGGYDYWQLVHIARSPAYTLPPIPREYFDRLHTAERRGLGFKPLVPGMAQIYKGDKAKGVFSIISISALSIAIIPTGTAVGLRRDDLSRELTEYWRRQQQNPTWNISRDRVEYAEDELRRAKAGRNVVMFSALAFYGWNIIDGFTAKSRSNDNRRAFAPNSDFMLMPYVDSQSKSGGLAISFKF